MIYASSYGETFKMDCGKRHGTTVLSMSYTDTFQDCRKPQVLYNMLANHGSKVWKAVLHWLRAIALTTKLVSCAAIASWDYQC